MGLLKDSQTLKISDSKKVKTIKIILYSEYMVKTQAFERILIFRWHLIYFQVTQSQLEHLPKFLHRRSKCTYPTSYVLGFNIP